MLDVLLLVPMSSNEGLWIDAFTRRTVTAHVYRPLDRARGFAEWRREFEKYRASCPSVVCAILRRVFPGATLVVGGAAYATSAETYLSVEKTVELITLERRRNEKRRVAGATG